MLHFPAITQIRLRCAASVAAFAFSLGAYPKVAWPQCQMVPDKFLASDGAGGEQFGHSVAISDNVAVVGAGMDNDLGLGSGSAYVLRFNGSTWLEEQKLLALDGSAYEWFGSSVAVSGNVVVVGAWGDDDNGTDSGSAYVFRFNGSSWVQEQKLLASDGAGSDNFAISVAVSGNVAVVGAQWDSNGNGRLSGSAYVYRFNGSTWVQEQKLLASDGVDYDFFGHSVAVSTDVVVVSSHRDDDNGTNSGSAYVFRYNGSTWIEEQKLLAADGAAGDFCSWSVAVSGDVAVVGAWRDGDFGYESGSAYVFAFDGSSWIQQAKLLASDGASGDGFGYSVGVSGDTALVGSYRHPTATAISGAAYVYGFDGAEWVEQDKLIPSDGGDNDLFGYSVGVAGAVAVIGSHQDDDIGLSSGSVYMFEEQCASPGCVSGAECDDGNPCTNDSCSSGVCVHANITNSCNDGNACTENDLCSAGICSGTLIDCNDGNPCTNDFCSNGSCQHTNNTNACNDGDSCTANDLCSAGICSGTPVDCDDGNACTGDSCSGGVCQHVSNTNGCNDGDSCTTGDRCSDGVCVGTELDCSDGIACTVDLCVGGICGHDTFACECTANVDCSDGNTCTTDWCSNGSCQHTNNTNFCNDGNACTQDDRCSNGSCSGTPVDCDDGNSCTNDFCSNGSCQHPNNANACDDGDSCTANDRCSNGFCSGTPVDCDDGVPCTFDSCTNGGCHYDPTGCDCFDDSDCADANPCTTDICDLDRSCVNDLISNCCGNGSCEAAEDPCSCSVDCGVPATIEFDCANGLDDDCDGWIDDNDLDCSSPCLPFGAYCTANSECCSGKCKGKEGRMNCKKNRTPHGQ